jgi:hypothetical protein
MLTFVVGFLQHVPTVTMGIAQEVLHFAGLARQRLWLAELC